MIDTLSPNTQAILLLTAPLMVGRRHAPDPFLTPAEYKRLVRRLLDLQTEPADLLSARADELVSECQAVVDTPRLRQLLNRGFQLGDAVERWRARAIWVMSRADPEYPRRIKAALRENAPPVLYGCGEKSKLLDAGGLAVVGSRHADETLLAYTKAVARLAAKSGIAIVSGGAKGIDQAAMRGALDAGGAAVGVLADSLERVAMDRIYRDWLLERRLVLVSPFDPGAGFNVGNAMQRNKLIYALADAALVVNADLKKGGTWAGAVEQLDKLRLVTVYVRATGEPSSALDALRQKGALPWPEPKKEDALRAALAGPDLAGLRSEPALFHPGPAQVREATPDGMASPMDELEHGLPVGTEVSDRETRAEFDDKGSITGSAVSVLPQTDSGEPSSSFTLPTDVDPGDRLLATVRDVIGQLLTVPMKDSEVATVLRVTNAQAKAWLQQLIDEGFVEKNRKPAGYRIKSRDLFS